MLYDDWPKDRAFGLTEGLWRYISEFERSDERVIEAAMPDLLDLIPRIRQLVGKVSKRAA